MLDTAVDVSEESRPILLPEDWQRSSAQEIAQKYLAKRNLIKGKTPDGHLICDTWAIARELKLSGEHEKDKLGSIALEEVPDSTRTYRMKIPLLMAIFEGQEVYDVSDFDQETKATEQTAYVPEPKPFFYVPESDKAALTIEDIRQADFHIGAWEISSTHRPDVYPTKAEGSDSQLRFTEVVTACLIYNKNFGNGQRNENGQLMVTWPDGQRKPITGEFFEEWGYIGQRSEKGRVSLMSPAAYFYQEAPALIKAGLIDPAKDFRTVSGSSTEVAFGAGFKAPREKGLIMIDGIRYGLGTEYEGSKGFIVHKLNKEWVVILAQEPDQTVRVHTMFQLYDPESDGGATGVMASGHRYMRKGEIHFASPADLAAEQPHIPGLVHNIERFFNFSIRVAQEAGFSLGRLNSDEQARALALSIQYDTDAHFWDFIRQKGLRGLRTLMLVDGNEAAVKSLMMGELDTKFTSILTVECDDIMSSITRPDSASARGSADDQAREVILVHARQLVSASMAAARGDIPGIDEYEAIALLRRFRANIESILPHKGISPVYSEILQLFESHPQEDVRALALARIQAEWESTLAQEARGRDEKQAAVLEAVTKFYQDNETLFATASETTGDTMQELEQFKNYDLRERVKGIVADLGCGFAARLATPKAQLLAGRAEVIGVDLIPPTESSEPNLHFLQGDLTHIPMDTDSVDVAEANWSVLNDALLRSQQLGIFSEVSRILKVGGRFRFDVPYLEGGEGSWLEAAHAYRQRFPAAQFGMIVGNFPTGAKEFYIYPQSELKALLVSHGFDVENVQEWRTASGKPRLTFEARLTKRMTPFTLPQMASQSGGSDQKLA